MLAVEHQSADHETDKALQHTFVPQLSGRFHQSRWRIPACFRAASRKVVCEDAPGEERECVGAFRRNGGKNGQRRRSSLGVRDPKTAVRDPAGSGRGLLEAML